MQTQFASRFVSLQRFAGDGLNILDNPQGSLKDPSIDPSIDPSKIPLNPSNPTMDSIIISINNYIKPIQR